jgi:hypothetical protein
MPVLSILGSKLPLSVTRSQEGVITIHRLASHKFGRIVHLGSRVNPPSSYQPLRPTTPMVEVPPQQPPRPLPAPAPRGAAMAGNPPMADGATAPRKPLTMTVAMSTTMRTKRSMIMTVLTLTPPTWADCQLTPPRAPTRGKGGRARRSSLVGRAGCRTVGGASRPRPAGACRRGGCGARCRRA